MGQDSTTSPERPGLSPLLCQQRPVRVDLDNNSHHVVRGKMLLVRNDLNFLIPLNRQEMSESTIFFMRKNH